MQSLRSVLLVILAVGLNSSWGRADDARRVDGSQVHVGSWGTITGQIVIKGDPPAGNDEKLVVDPESGGIANVFVFLNRAGAIHPDLKAIKDKEIAFDTKNGMFVPHALIVRTDQSIRVINTDPQAANVHTFPLRNEAINLFLRPNDRRGMVRTLVNRETIPFQVKDDIHADKSAYVLVVDHPYAALTDKQGRFTITDLPAGECELVVWHEVSGYLERKLRVEVVPDKRTELPAMIFPLDENQAVVQATLNGLHQVNFHGTPLVPTLQYLSGPYTIPIIVDEKELKAAGVSPTSPVTLQGSMPLSEVLDAILTPLDLTYVIKGRTIAVTADPIQVALNVQSGVSLANMPLGAALKSLSDAHHLEIVIDEASLRTAGIEPDAPVSLQAEDPLSELLQKMLAPLKLKYIVKDGKIVVIADGAAKE